MDDNHNVTVTGIVLVDVDAPAEEDEENQELVEQAEADITFGIEFPQMFDPPEVAEQAVVRGPVTSGGDTANYGPQTETGEDN